MTVVKIQRYYVAVPRFTKGQEAKVTYASKDGKSNRVSPSMERPANLSCPTPKRGEQLVIYHRFRNTVRDYRSSGNNRFKPIPKIIYKGGVISQNGKLDLTRHDPPRWAKESIVRSLATAVGSHVCVAALQTSVCIPC